jgi:hypothetical protein
MVGTKRGARIVCTGATREVERRARSGINLSQSGQKMFEPFIDVFRVQGSRSAPFPYTVRGNENAGYILMNFEGTQPNIHGNH